MIPSNKRSLHARNGARLHGASRWEFLLIFLLVGILAFTFFPALRKMQDQGAVSEMRQVAIFVGRTVLQGWNEVPNDERQPQAAEEILRTTQEAGFALAPTVSILNTEFVPGGVIEMTHIRFPDHRFVFSYEGQRIPDREGPIVSPVEEVVEIP